MSINPDLSTFPLYCIYILKDTVQGNAYLQWSNGNSINQLSATLTELRRGIHPNKLLQYSFNRGFLTLEVLKSYPGLVDTLLLKTEAVMLFRHTGLLDMTGKYNKSIYKVSRHVRMPYTSRHDNKVPLVYVTVRSTSLEAIVCAIFDTVYEAEEWMSTVYPAGIANTLYFMDNELTKTYHNTKGYKLIRFKKST